MKDIQDAQICKNKIIEHIGKQYSQLPRPKGRGLSAMIRATVD